MGLAPEFFMLLGIDIFSAISLLSALLDEDIPSSVQWLFQGAAVMGLGQMFVSQEFINAGVFPRDPTDPTRFWISVLYLSAAIANVIGLNVYLAAARHKMTLASTFTGTVTVPTMMISAFFVSSFVSQGGVISFTPGTIGLLVISAIISGLSIFGFLRQAARRMVGSVGGATSRHPSMPGSMARASGVGAGAVTKPPGAPGLALPGFLPTKQQAEWEEAPGSEERGGEN